MKNDPRPRKQSVLVCGRARDSSRRHQTLLLLSSSVYARELFGIVRRAFGATEGKLQEAAERERGHERVKDKRERKDLPQLIGTVPVEADADVDGYDGEDDAEQDQRSGLADWLDSDVHHHSHNEQQGCPVQP